MEKVDCGGLTVKNTMVIFLRTKGMGLENLDGRTVESMMVNGQEANNMELVYIEMEMVMKGKDNGLMEEG